MRELGFGAPNVAPVAYGAPTRRYTFFPPKVAPGERTSYALPWLCCRWEVVNSTPRACCRYAALIFMIGAGIGTMIGGMLGTVLRVHLKMWDREAQLAHPAL